MNIISQDKEKSKNIEDVNKVKPLSFGWPGDKHSGFLNYAQELHFNKDVGLHQLEIAKAHYNKGYDRIEIYQANPGVYDLYKRNRYEYDAISPYGLGVFRDFRTAEYWLFKSLKIIDDKLRWDPLINTNPEYNELVQNTFKNLLYITVYNARFHKALEYLDIYKQYNPDQKFIDEWGSRIAGNIILLHTKYKWVFTGKQTPPYLKQKHLETLLKLIEKHYPENAELQNELKKRVYREYHIFSQEKRDKTAREVEQEQGKEETTTK